MPTNVRPNKGSGSTSRAPPVAPMSERQQLALLMQMTSSGESGSRSPSSGSRSRDRNERGWTPLHEACNHGWYEVALRLVQAGANINAKGLDNDSPLHDAVVNGHLKLIKLLVEKGADIHAKNSKGKSPLDLASASVQPYLFNTNLPVPETASSSSTRVPLRSRDDKKLTASSSSEKQKSGSSASSSSGDTMDNKSSTAAEDVYEFKSAKDTDSSSEKNTEGADSEMEVTDPLSVPAAGASEDSSKRNYTEFEGSEDNEKDEENKRKKRKEDNGKDSGKTTQRGTGQSKGQGNKQSLSNTKYTGSNSSKSSGSNADKKSPDSSPKPSAGNSNSSDAEVDGASNSGDGKTDLKVPPLKIVIPQSSTSEQDTGTSRNGKNNSQRTHQALPYVVASSNSNDATDKEVSVTTASPENTATSKESDKKEPVAGQGDEQTTNNSEAEPSVSLPSSSNSTPPAPPPVELHPRKRKMKQSRDQANAQAQQQTVEPPESAAETREVHPHEQPITNCYKLFMNIRRQIEKRRKGLFLVQPKPPQGFKDYLMNRCTYVLANTAPTTPNINYPPTLPSQLKDLFAEQEKERYRLRMQHVIEKEKLVLSVEQEILRVHGRAARALANQSLPFSVCTILRDEEVYNLITPEQEEKDRNARSRYNGRLFLSWLQDVDDKWEKIKEHMLLRHHHEAESLHAVQKMNWEWKLKELNMCDKKSTPKIDELHVPEVHVSDDFDLLPA